MRTAKLYYIAMSCEWKKQNVPKMNDILRFISLQIKGNISHPNICETWANVIDPMTIEPYVFKKILRHLYKNL